MRWLRNLDAAKRVAELFEHSPVMHVGGMSKSSRYGSGKGAACAHCQLSQEGKHTPYCIAACNELETGPDDIGECTLSGI